MKQTICAQKSPPSENGKRADRSPHLSFPPDLAPCHWQVAGLHRADPSVTLDKEIWNCYVQYTALSGICQGFKKGFPF